MTGLQPVWRFSQKGLMNFLQSIWSFSINLSIQCQHWDIFQWDISSLTFNELFILINQRTPSSLLGEKLPAFKLLYYYAKLGKIFYQTVIIFDINLSCSNKFNSFITSMTTSVSKLKSFYYSYFLIDYSSCIK